MLISIVIPAYNEEQGIKKVISDIPYSEFKGLGHQVEIIVVDNNSTDLTAQVAQNLGARVIKNPIQGYGASYKVGMKEAKGEVIVTCDGDGTYPIHLACKLVERLKREKLEFITTNRFSKGYTELSEMPIVNRIGNIGLSLALRLLYGVSLGDSQSGMWVFNRHLLDQMKINSNQMAFSQEIKIEVIHYLRFSWLEVDIPYEERIGDKKLRIVRDGLNNIFCLVKKRVQR